MRRRVLALVVVIAAVTAGGVFWYLYRAGRLPTGLGGPETYTVDLTDYHPPAPPAEELLTDDRLEEKHPPPFDPALVDSRPLGPGAWLLNASAAVLRLDVPMVHPDTEANLLTLYPSYAAAAAGPGLSTHSILPSVNMIDGKAKQFDDGLYAALDQAYYRGLPGKLRGHVELVRRLYEKVGKDSPAAPSLAAGLELAGESVEAADRAAKDRLVAEFRANELLSRPIGFYTWNETLTACFRFLRFFQQPLPPAVAQALARALADDPALLADYRKALAFYARLTNPARGPSVADLLPGAKAPPGPASLFPASTSKEVVLFEKLFPTGLPPDADLMRALISAVRSGRVDLTPTRQSGWYEHQVYALETMLLPEKAPEKDKLILTRSYKKRMVEAFQALVTKRRETHVRQGGMAMAAAAMPLEHVHPRLRVEPNPSYYLRTARAYAFLANFLESAVGPDGLQRLHGLKEGGERAPDLHAELHALRDLFYGLYLVSAEDIGLRPTIAPDEPVDRRRCLQRATEWLPKALRDEDLAADTRVAVPIYVDPPRGRVRLWVTLGVRLAKLEASYALAPSVKPVRGPGEWKRAEPYQLGAANYLIPVDEFAEVERTGLRVPTRAELRAVCDRAKTKEAIVQALRE